ncbi:MAG: glycosyltransferase family 2 protein [Alphaproteobacteria bacterium]
MVAVSVVVPTFRRTASLERTLASCLRQRDADPAGFEIVVVDNCPDGSARAVTEAVAARANVRIAYIHERRSGVSHARNTGVANARGHLLAFLDDDEEASDRWLAHLVETQVRFDADIVFGPVVAAFERDPPIDPDFVALFFSRRDPGPTRLIDRYHGSGNSLLVRDRCILSDQPFDPRMTRIGGEDTMLFEALKRAGRSFAWCAEASVLEHVDGSRMTLRYLAKRSFRRGQSPPIACAMTRPPDRLAIARWMAIGAGQFLVHGVAGLGLAAIRSRRALDQGRRAIEGAGKVLWMQSFRPHDYGA